MHDLTIGSRQHQSHQQAFGSGKRAKALHSALDGSPVNAQALDDAQDAPDDLFDRQKALRQDAAAVGGIIQGTLERRKGSVIPGRPWQTRHYACH